MRARCRYGFSPLCKTHATVALSGEGADEIFAGYLTYRANQLARMRGPPAVALRLALQGLHFWPVSDEKISLEYKLKRFLKAACCRRNAPMSTGMEPSPSRKGGFVATPLAAAMDNILAGLASSLALTRACSRISPSTNSTIWPTTSW